MATAPETQPEQAPPECSICGGSGWKMIENPGKASRATRCDCFLAGRADRLLKVAGIPRRYENCTLDSFKWELKDKPEYDKSREEARLIVELFVRNFPVRKQGLLFTGDIGTGKTHLAVGIIQALIRTKGIRCLFCDYRELLKEIQHSYNPNVDTTELGILNPVLEAEVVVLDELGAIRPSQWVWDTVSYVINHRYNEKKTTIITTNFPDLAATEPEISFEDATQTDQPKPRERVKTLGDRITDRMRSRLHEMCRIVQLKGTDYRMRPRDGY